MTVALLIAIVLASGGFCEAAQGELKAPQEVDLPDWRGLPVYHHGRAMPLDTLAKVAGETISGSGASVKIELAGYYSEEELASSALQSALEMFPGGEQRRIPVSEMLLSWLVEPEKWEDVPFILCEHRDLHKSLGLESVTEPGLHRKFVSPRQVAESEKLRDYLLDFNDRRTSARSADQKFEPSETDNKVRALLDRYEIFRKLTHQPRLPVRHTPVLLPGGRDEFAVHFRAAMEVLLAPNETKKVAMVESLRNFIQIQESHGIQSEIADAARTAMIAFGQLQQLQDRMRPADVMSASPEDDEPDEPLTLAQVEAAVVDVRVEAARLRKILEREKNKVFQEDGVTPSQAETLRPMFDELAHKAEKLTHIGRQMHLALYDNGAQFHGHKERQSDEFQYGATVYVTPALNVAALKKERDTANEAEPWLSLQTVLYGSDALLFGEDWPEQNYSRDHVMRVRRAWNELADAYTDRGSDKRDQRVEAAQVKLARDLRALGEGVEPDRIKLIDQQLPKDQRDGALIQYTRYPVEGRLDAELTYNRIKPFRWSWVICLLSVAGFALAFGVMKRYAFWAGVGFLVLVVLWSTYGFYLRVMVTNWAPVTNMYETVVFVPWVGAVLALWFLLLPVMWPGMKDAWRLTATPFTWEATELDQRQHRLFGGTAATITGALAAVGRLAIMGWLFYQLAFAPYSDGGRSIFYLIPNTQAVNHSSLSGLLNVYGVYLVNLLCLLAIVWFAPRVLLAGFISLLTVPLSWLRRDEERSAVGEMLARAYSRRAFGIAGAAVACFLFMLAAWAPSILDEDFRPLMPVLRSNFWLTIHVLTIVASYGAGLLAWGIGLIGLSYYLFGAYRDPVVAANVPKGMQPAGGGKEQIRLGRQPPHECATLANYAYRCVQVAVLLLAGGTILGGLWADVSWGRFWGWDPKEIWALISTLVYLAILHGRFAGLFNNFGMIAGTVVGAIMIAFSWYGVNFILPLFSPDGTAGLHSYGSGAGGQIFVFPFLALNVLYVIAASIRYSIETREVYTPVQHTPEVFVEQVSRGAQT